MPAKKAPAAALPPTSKLRAQKRRAELLKAARKVFAEHGYEAATVQAIVREAGVAQGTFYLYFPAKQDALVELRADLFRKVVEAVLQAVGEEEDRSAWVRLGVSAVFNTAYRHRDLLRVLVATAGTAGGQGTDVALQACVDRLAVVLEHELAAGRLAAMDPRATAHMVVVLLEQLASSAITQELPRPPGATEDALERFLRSALQLGTD
ncbi:MAG: TetR family transcriptional regulator [Cyanobacteria bacterium RYN_339]|nr:TetR family transcriptional regulator [Cyanobacteria bacterium RYN_339]